MGKTLEITDANIEEVLASGKPAVIDFWASWCGPCKMIAPVLDELTESHNETVTIAKINVDENPESTTRFGIRSLPTIVFIKDGVVVDKNVGLTGKLQLEAKMKTQGFIA